MIKADIFVNGKFWRIAELPGISKHFQVLVANPEGGRGTPVDVYVEDNPYFDGTTEFVEYISNINDPELEINDEYTLKWKTNT